MPCWLSGSLVKNTFYLYSWRIGTAEPGSISGFITDGVIGIKCSVKSNLVYTKKK